MKKHKSTGRRDPSDGRWTPPFERAPRPGVDGGWGGGWTGQTENLGGMGQSRGKALQVLGRLSAGA